MSEVHDMGPDEVALRRDLEALPFKLGARRGKWELLLLAFPYAYFRIAAPPRALGPPAFLLRVECLGYRATAPTAALWDARFDKALAEELKPRQVTGQVVMAFSPGCGQCLYHPIDRLARGHWADHADLAWRPGSDITTFLECVHGLLVATEYHSSDAPLAAAVLQGGPLDGAADRAA